MRVLPSGYCKMVLEYGFKRVVGNRPVYLHVTTAKAKDMYNKMGFEVTSQLPLLNFHPALP